MASIAAIAIVFLFILLIVGFVFGAISLLPTVVIAIVLLFAAVVTIKYLGW